MGSKHADAAVKSETQTALATRAPEGLKHELPNPSDNKNKADNDDDHSQESEDDIFGNAGQSDVKTKAEANSSDINNANKSINSKSA